MHRYDNMVHLPVTTMLPARLPRRQVPHRAVHRHPGHDDGRPGSGPHLHRRSPGLPSGIRIQPGWSPVEVGGEGVALGGGGDGVVQVAVGRAAAFFSSSTGKRARHIATRSTVSIARPNGEDTCSRLAIRRTVVETFVPAPWNRAGLKNAASPFSSGNWV